MLPSPAERAQQWPNLRDEDFEETSLDTIEYNCIAFAAGDQENWWWPNPLPSTDYWPDGVPRVATLQNFILAYGTLGYEACADGEPEDGFEKIVIYIDGLQVPTHAARQLADGTWKSKLGSDIDVSHYNLSCLEDGIYGTVSTFMKRQSPGAQ